MSVSKDERYQERLLEWFGKMVNVAKTMPEHERQELEEWERVNLDGRSLGTSDWPGWEKYIDKPPVPSS